MATKITRLEMSALNLDVMDHQAAPEQWTGLTNAAIRSGVYQTAQTDVNAFTITSGATSPRWLLYCPISGNGYWISAGRNSSDTANQLAVTDQATWKTITPAAWTVSGNNIYTGGTLNSIPFVSNGTDLPVSWAGDFATPTVAAALTGWPANYACKALRPFRDFLIAMHITESTTPIDRPDQLWWSDRANAGALPTAWNATATNEAGDATLGDSPGAIVDGAQLGDGFMIYKQSSAYLMQEIGLPQVMGIRKAFDGFGALARNCIQSIPGTGHIVVTEGDIVLHDGRSAQSIADGSVRRHLFDSIYEGMADEVYTAFDPYYKEFWVCWNNVATGNAKEALIWNGSSWSRRELPSATAYGASGPSFATSGYISGKQAPALVTANFDGVGPSELVAHMGADLTSYPSVSEFIKEGVVFTPGQAATVKRVRPIGEALGSSYLAGKVYVGQRKTPKDAWDYSLHSSGITYTDLNTDWLTFGVTGNEFAFKFEGTTNRYFRLAGFDVEWEPAGRFSP